MARALVGFGLGGPEAAVLLDEPLSAVEIASRTRLLLAAFADVAEQPIPVVLVSHDREEIAAVSTRPAALADGRLITAGPRRRC